jgi:hypothetical protein
MLDFPPVLANTTLARHGASRQAGQPKGKVLHQIGHREQEVALFQNGVCLWKNCESSVGASSHSPQISLAAFTPFGENPASS